MLDLVNILKHCPEDTELYSPALGTCKLIDTSAMFNDDDYPITVQASDKEYYSFTKHGRLYNIEEGKCLLFPSKDQRDWNKFRLPCKRGDVMRTDSSVFIVCNFDKDLYPRVYCSVSFAGHLQINEDPETSDPYTPDFYYPADTEAIEYLVEALDKAGYMWNSETLSIERSNIPASLPPKEPEVSTIEISEESTDTQDTVHCLKPFDKVLVSRCNSIWFPAFFWEICDGYYRITDGKIYERCIPYEGNEDLLGASSIWFKPDKAHKC